MKHIIESLQTLAGAQNEIAGALRLSENVRLVHRLAASLPAGKRLEFVQRAMTIAYVFRDISCWCEFRGSTEEFTERVAILWGAITPENGETRETFLDQAREKTCRLTALGLIQFLHDHLMFIA